MKDTYFCVINLVLFCLGGKYYRKSENSLSLEILLSVITQTFFLWWISDIYAQHLHLLWDVFPVYPKEKINYLKSLCCWLKDCLPVSWCTPWVGLLCICTLNFTGMNLWIIIMDIFCTSWYYNCFFLSLFLNQKILEHLNKRFSWGNIPDSIKNSRDFFVCFQLEVRKP